MQPEDENTLFRDAKFSITGLKLGEATALWPPPPPVIRAKQVAFAVLNLREGVDLTDVKARMTAPLMAMSTAAFFYSGKTPLSSVESATCVQIGDDIDEPADSLQFLDRPDIEGGVRAGKPTCSDLIVTADNCIERVKQLHEKDGKLEGLRAGLKSRATAPDA